MSVINSMLSELDERQRRKPAKAPAQARTEERAQAKDQKQEQEPKPAWVPLIDHTFAPPASAGPVRPLSRLSRGLLGLAVLTSLWGGYHRLSGDQAETAALLAMDLNQIDAPSAGLGSGGFGQRSSSVLPAVEGRSSRPPSNAQAQTVLDWPSRSALPRPGNNAPPAALSPELINTQAITAQTITGQTDLLAEPLAAAQSPRQIALLAPAPDAAPNRSFDSLMSAEPAAGPATVEKRPNALSSAQRSAMAYRQAMDLGATGHSSLAIDKALEALKIDPTYTPARQLAAALMVEKDRLEEAGALLREGLARQPQQPQLLYLLARLKADTGDAAGALATLAQTTELGPDGHGLRAVILARQGRYAEALPAYEAAVRLAPENAAWWLGLGVAYDAEGQSANAKSALQRARSIGSLNAELLAFVEQKLAALN